VELYLLTLMLQCMKGAFLKQRFDYCVAENSYTKCHLSVLQFSGGQSQLVCIGCRNLLMYPAGATSVCCAVCSTVTSVPAPGTHMNYLHFGLKNLRVSNTASEHWATFVRELVSYCPFRLSVLFNQLRSSICCIHKVLHLANYIYT